MSEQSKAPDVMPEVIMARPMLAAEPQGQTHTSGPWALDDPYRNATEYVSRAHCNALVGAAYEDAAKCSYHNPSKEPDYPYDERGALKRVYRDDFGDVKDPDGFAGQIALHDAWQAAQDILALTPASAQAAYDSALSAARAEGYAKGLEGAASLIQNNEEFSTTRANQRGVQPRSDGNLSGLAYAKAILALKEQPDAT